MAGKRKYSDQEVRAIIDHALDNDTPRDVSHDELVTIASEIGLSRESIEKAARELETRRATDSAKLAVVGRRRRWLLTHAGSYLLVNLFLFAVNFLTSPGQWWVLFPVLSWGLALIFHAWAALSMSVSERAVAREQKRQLATLAARSEEQPRAKRVRLEIDGESAVESAVERDAAEDDVALEPGSPRRSQER